jgi:hypothetical protein
VHVVDKPDREDRAWVLSVAHRGVGRLAGLNGRIDEEARIVQKDDLGISA